MKRDANPGTTVEGKARLGKLCMHGLSPEDALRAVLAGRYGEPISPPPSHKKRKGPGEPKPSKKP